MLVGGWLLMSVGTQNVFGTMVDDTKGADVFVGQNVSILIRAEL